jgi:hypothetical protein
MRKVTLTVVFTDEGGTARSETRTVDTNYEPDAGGEHRVRHILGAELAVTVGPQEAPKHNAAARQWLNFPKRSVGMHRLFDVQNSQALWLELSNLVMGAEADLALAQAFKHLEPAQEPSSDDEAALNDLYYIHDRKVNLLNQAVQALVKAQELVNRLLHEATGGDLVDTTKQEWERTQLIRRNVEKGLAAKLAAGQISQTDYDAIKAALEIPQKHPKADIAVRYRNRLMHHVRPSVDYAMFFSVLQSRLGEEIRDAQGKVIGRRHSLFARVPAEFSFSDLHAAFSEYLDAVAAMLQKLSEIELLR